MGRSLNNVKYKIDFIFFIPNVKTPIILLFKNIPHRDKTCLMLVKHDKNKIIIIIMNDLSREIHLVLKS